MIERCLMLALCCQDKLMYQMYDAIL